MDSTYSSLSLDRILNVVVDELVRSRLRNRALLRVLVEREVISRAEYVEAYKAEEGENFEAICDMMLLPSEEFREKHGTWLDRERDRFGFSPSSHVRVALTPQISSIGKSSGPAKKKRKKA